MPRRGGRGATSIPLHELEVIPKIVQEHLPSPEWLKGRCQLRRGFIVLVPYGSFRQGLVEEGAGEEKVLTMPKMPVWVPLADGSATPVMVPVINGNSVFGALKNTVSQYMFDWYFEHRRDVLEAIYKPGDPVSTLAAALFRMKTPFLTVHKGVPYALVRAVWSNFIWTLFGIGIASWLPQRKFVTSPAVPVYRELRNFATIYEEARRIFPELPPLVSRI